MTNESGLFGKFNAKSKAHLCPLTMPWIKNGAAVAWRCGLI
jgi:hypothetical protein